MSAERLTDERLAEIEREVDCYGNQDGDGLHHSTPAAVVMLADVLAELTALRQIEEAARRLVLAQDAVNQISSRQYWATGEDARAADAEFRDAGDAFDALVRAALPEAPQDQT